MLVATFPCCCTNFLFQLWKRIQTCSEKHPVDVSAFEKLTDEEKMNKRSSKMIFPSMDSNEGRNDNGNRMKRIMPCFIRDCDDLWILSSRCVKIGVAIDWKNCAEFVINCYQCFFAPDGMRLIIKSIERRFTDFLFPPRERIKCTSVW